MLDNIPDIINRIHELNSKKSTLSNEYKNIDQEIAALIQEWQSLCDHPATYVKDNKCSACSYEFPEKDSIIDVEAEDAT